jgi:hypothetical protein
MLSASITAGLRRSHRTQAGGRAPTRSTRPQSGKRKPDLVLLPFTHEDMEGNHEAHDSVLCSGAGPRDTHKSSQPAAAADQMTIGDLDLFALGGDGGLPDANGRTNIGDNAERPHPNLRAVSDSGLLGRGAGSRGSTRTAPGGASVGLNGVLARGTGRVGGEANMPVVAKPLFACFLAGGCFLVAGSLPLRRKMRH